MDPSQCDCVRINFESGRGRAAHVVYFNAKSLIFELFPVRLPRKYSEILPQRLFVPNFRRNLLLGSPYHTALLQRYCRYCREQELWTDWVTVEPPYLKHEHLVHFVVHAPACTDCNNLSSAGSVTEVQTGSGLLRWLLLEWTHRGNKQQRTDITYMRSYNYFLLFLQIRRRAVWFPWCSTFYCLFLYNRCDFDHLPFRNHDFLQV